MNIDEQRRLRVAVCFLEQAQRELEILGFHGVADHVRFCANDVALKQKRLDGATSAIEFKNGRFVTVGVDNE